jgi:hypothetical protein
MILLPFGNHTILILNPGNIKLLKEGLPLPIGNLILCFTPDESRLLKELGSTKSSSKPGETIIDAVALSGEDIDAALKRCMNLPEVE